MAFRCVRLLRIVRRENVVFRNKSFALPIQNDKDGIMNKPIIKPMQHKTENNLTYLEDPDTFGTLSLNVRNQEDKFEDEADLKEQDYIGNLPLESQKFTIKQYADLIKQYISYKRLKEAIDVLEVRMLTIDRVQPENYIYNILIGACADVGFTKKAFKLFNDMKRRGLKPTGDTYTCLFQACVNSPWAKDGLNNAHHLRRLMIEKGIEPNLTNYNVMIKAFGRCGDINTAFQIVDEMVAKKIKIRVHTFNHLLHACISDKDTGLRHALVVWRKMLKMREKPNLHSFNLMLKCIKDCNLGTKADIEELIYFMRENIALRSCQPQQLEIHSSGIKDMPLITSTEITSYNRELSETSATAGNITDHHAYKAVIPVESNIIYDKPMDLKKVPNKEDRNVPNLLSKVIQLQQVLALQEVHTVQDKFAVIGGQDDFFKEMNVYSVKPDIKTFTQMLPLLGTREAEITLLEKMETLNVKADIDFYNNLIKTRCLRLDYDGAIDVKDIILKENKRRKKLHPLKKQLQLKFNIMTYGVLALACRTKESAEDLINEMRENKLKINIEILGTLLKSGAVQNQIDYVLYIMNIVKEENIDLNQTFLKHLEIFSQNCSNRLRQMSGDSQSSDSVVRSLKAFLNIYKAWLKEINIEEILKPEHPWQQFRENYPETFQHTNVVIKEPKKFYKRNRKFVSYSPKV